MGAFTPYFFGYVICYTKKSPGQVRGVDEALYPLSVVL